MQDGLRQLVDTLCGLFESRNKESLLSDRIISYLQEHYTDKNLNVAAIGEEFGYVPRYISKIFKDETGVGLLDYINKMRVNEAKAIMKDKKRVLEEIAELVGFTNVNSFIRVFKKYEGMPPGKYRDMI